MKKIISILTLLVIILIQFTVYTYAANACSISLSSDNQSLNKSDELTVSLKMSNITIEDGISAFGAILEYSEDIFELIIDESEDAKEIISQFEGTEYEECKVLYVGQNDDDEEILNPWTILLLESEDGKGIVGITTESQKESQKIGKLKFKVKENAKTSSGEKITLEELTVMDSKDNDFVLSNAYTSVNVIGSQSISITNSTSNTSNKASNTSSTYNKTNKATSISNNLNTSTEASKDVPKAGSPIVLPIFLIMIAFIVYKYKKYSEIKNI